LTGSPVTFTATGSPGPAASIAVNAGNGQSAPVNTNVAIAPSVIVKDANGNGVAGVSVTFAVASGGGSATGAGTTTDATGIATVGSWKLGASPGANTLTASSGSLSGSPVTFTATGTVGPPASIAVNAGDGQTAAVHTNVPIVPSVVVKDAAGNPLSGVTVTWTVTFGGGIAGFPSSTTDASGVANVGNWNLGSAAGAQALKATVGGLSVTFSATATAGAPASIHINAGDGQTATHGTAVATPPSVIVRDQFNNVVGNASVTFAVASGGGSVTGASAVTTAGGIATVGSWTLGPAPGTNTLTATVNGLSVTFTATGN
jgi:adhesin/invasin